MDGGAGGGSEGSDIAVWGGAGAVAYVEKTGHTGDEEPEFAADASLVGARGGHDEESECVVAMERCLERITCVILLVAMVFGMFV